MEEKRFTPQASGTREGSGRKQGSRWLGAWGDYLFLQDTSSSRLSAPHASRTRGPRKVWSKATPKGLRLETYCTLHPGVVLSLVRIWEDLCFTCLNSTNILYYTAHWTHNRRRKDKKCCTLGGDFLYRRLRSFSHYFPRKCSLAPRKSSLDPRKGYITPKKNTPWQPGNAPWHTIKTPWHPRNASWPPAKFSLATTKKLPGT